MECEGGGGTKRGGELRGEGGGRGLFWKRQGKIFVYESYRLGRLWRGRGGDTSKKVQSIFPRYRFFEVVVNKLCEMHTIFTDITQ